MRGFSLIEILIGVVILSLLIAGIFAVLYVADQSWNADMAMLDLQQQTRLAMEGMLKELRQSRSQDITISDQGARIQFNIPTDIVSVPITYSQTIIYYLNNSQLMREHPTGTLKILANDISVLSFCCWQAGSCDTNCSNSDILEIQLEANKTVKQRPFSFSLTEKARLRNE